MAHPPTDGVKTTVNGPSLFGVIRFTVGRRRPVRPPRLDSIRHRPGRGINAVSQARVRPGAPSAGSTQPEVLMNAEAAKPATPGPLAPGHVTPAGTRRKSRPRLDLQPAGPRRPAGTVLRPRPAARRHRPRRRGAPRPSPRRRPRTAAPRLRARGVLAPRPDAQERRAVHHPPARRHPHPGRTRRRDHDVDRLPAARHGRGHRRHARPGGRGVRRGGALSRRRRHQVGEGRLRRRRRARDLPQDARRHRQRRPRDVDQTRRPAAQHAHPRRDAPRQAGTHRQGDT